MPRNPNQANLDHEEYLKNQLKNVKYILLNSKKI